MLALRVLWNRSEPSLPYRRWCSLDRVKHFSLLGNVIRSSWREPEGSSNMKLETWTQHILWGFSSCDARDSFVHLPLRSEVFLLVAGVMDCLYLFTLFLAWRRGSFTFLLRKLSQPHTSMTSLHTSMCMLPRLDWPLTVSHFWLSFFCILHCVNSKGFQDMNHEQSTSSMATTEL